MADINDYFNNNGSLNINKFKNLLDNTNFSYYAEIDVLISSQKYIYSHLIKKINKDKFDKIFSENKNKKISELNDEIGPIIKYINANELWSKGSDDAILEVILNNINDEEKTNNIIKFITLSMMIFEIMKNHYDMIKMILRNIFYKPLTTISDKTILDDLDGFITQYKLSKISINISDLIGMLKKYFDDFSITNAIEFLINNETIITNKEQFEEIKKKSKRRLKDFINEIMNATDKSGDLIQRAILKGKNIQGITENIIYDLELNYSDYYGKIRNIVSNYYPYYEDIDIINDIGKLLYDVKIKSSNTSNIDRYAISASLVFGFAGTEIIAITFTILSVISVIAIIMLVLIIVLLFVGVVICLIWITIGLVLIKTTRHPYTIRNIFIFGFLGPIAPLMI